MASLFAGSLDYLHIAYGALIRQQHKDYSYYSLHEDSGAYTALLFHMAFKLSSTLRI